MLTNCLLVIDEDSPWNLVKEVLLVPGLGIQAVKSNANDLRGVLEEICYLKSQVVIIEEAATVDDQNSLSDMLTLSPDLKIILVSRDNNYIHVFRGADVLIESASEFLDIIRLKS